VEEIEAIIQGERVRKNDWAIIAAQLAKDVEEKGAIAAPTFEISADECPPDSFVPRLTYRLFGTWSTHEKYGRRFNAKTWVKAAPHGRTGTIRYLQQAPWVGAITAGTLWDKFGGEAVRILRESPDVACCAVDSSHFTLAKAQEAAAYLEKEKGLEGVSIDLMELLDKRGLPKKTAQKAMQQWGNRATEFIKKNPYLLMAFRGCGFLKTDAMYTELGHNPAARKRQAYCAWHAVATASNREGHTWHPKDLVVSALKAKISGAEVNAPAAVILAVRGKLLATKRDQLGNLWVAEYSKARAEQIVAERVAEMLLEEAEEIEEEAEANEPKQGVVESEVAA
jgi:hypothetical protein